MKLELFFVVIATFLSLQYANGQQHVQNSGIIGRFAGGSIGSRGGSSSERQRVTSTDRFAGGSIGSRGGSSSERQRVTSTDRFAGGSIGSRGGSSSERQRVTSTDRSSSTVGQVGQSGLLGGESGFDPSLTSLVGWYPFGGVFGGGFGGGGVISTNVQNRNEVWGRGNFFSGRELGGARIAGSGNFDSGFAGGFRQSDNNVGSGFEARFRQTDDEQGLPGASDFRGSGGSVTDKGPYKVNYGYQKNDDYEKKYYSDYKKGHGEQGYDNYNGYDHKNRYQNKEYSDNTYDKKEYHHHKGKYDYKEDGENRYGRYYDSNLGNDRKEYDYKGNGYSNYNQGNSGYHNKGYSNYHKGYNKKGYYNKDYENNNNYNGYDKKGYSGSGYHGYDGDRRDRHGDNDGWYQDRNGYSRHQRYRDSRGPEYDRYRENRYHDHGYSRRGRYDYHDDRKHRDNSGYYKKQYDSYIHESRYYGAGTKTNDDHGYDRKYDNYASNDYPFKGQYLYGIFRDRSQGFRYGPNSGHGYYDDKKKYDNY